MWWPWKSKEQLFGIIVEGKRGHYWPQLRDKANNLILEGITPGLKLRHWLEQR